MLFGKPLRSADGAAAGSGAGGASPAAGAPPAAAAPSAPASPPAAADPPKKDAVDVDAIKAKERERAHKALLEELGVDNIDALKAAKKAADDAAAEKLSASERAAKAFEQSESKRTKAEKEASEYRAKAEKLETHLTLVRAGVAPDELDVAAYLLSEERDKAGKDFDQDKALAKLREKKPYLFGAAAAPPPATTTTQPRQPAPPGADSAKTVPDARQMTPQEWQQFKRQHHLSLQPFAAA